MSGGLSYATSGQPLTAGGLARATAGGALIGGGGGAAAGGVLTKVSGSACLVAGIQVLLGDGTSKAIADIEVGDQVLAADPETGETHAKPDFDTYIHHDVDTCVVETGSGTVTSTAEHPFWVDGRGWTPVRELQTGDKLIDADGVRVELVSVTPTGKTATVHNFHVADLHGYYVQAGDAWVRVHNSCETFANKMPGALQDEMADAERLGVTVSPPGTPGFDSAIGGGTVKWAILREVNLVVQPKFVGQEVSHAVLSQGAPVRAAGEADIAGTSADYFGLNINNHSGHFQPSAGSVQVGRDAFEQAGIPFP